MRKFVPLTLLFVSLLVWPGLANTQDVAKLAESTPATPLE